MSPRHLNQPPAGHGRPRSHFLIWGGYSFLSCAWLLLEIIILKNNYSETHAGASTESPSSILPIDTPVPLTPQPTPRPGEPKGYSEERTACILRLSGHALSSVPIITAGIVMCLVSREGVAKITSGGYLQTLVNCFLVLDCAMFTSGQLLLELGREYVAPILPPLVLLPFLTSILCLRASVSKVTVALCSFMVISCFGFYGIRLVMLQQRINAYSEGIFSQDGEYFYARIGTMIWEIFLPLGLLLPLLYRGLVVDFAHLSSTAAAGSGAIVRSRSTTPQGTMTNRLRIRTGLAADSSILLPNNGNNSNSGSGSTSGGGVDCSPSSPSSPPSKSYGTLVVSKDDPSGQATLVSSLVDRVSEMITEGEPYEKVLAFVKHELWLKQATSEDLNGGSVKKNDSTGVDCDFDEDGVARRNRTTSLSLPPELEPTIRTLEALLELVSHHQRLEQRNLKQIDIQQQQQQQMRNPAPNTVFATDPVYSMGDHSHQQQNPAAKTAKGKGWVLMDASESLGSTERDSIPVDSAVSPRGKVQDRTLLRSGGIQHNQQQQQQQTADKDLGNSSLFAVPPAPGAKPPHSMISIVANANGNTDALPSSDGEDRSSQLSSIQSSHSSFQSTPTHHPFPSLPPAVGGKLLPNEVYRHGSQTVASSNERKITMILLKFSYEVSSNDTAVQQRTTITSPIVPVQPQQHHNNTANSSSSAIASISSHYSSEEVAMALMQAHTILTTYANRVGAHVISLHGDRYLISFNTSSDSSQPELKAVQLMSRLQDTVKTRDAFSNVTFQSAICTGLAVVGKTMGSSNAGGTGIGEAFGAAGGSTNRNYYHQHQHAAISSDEKAKSNDYAVGEVKSPADLFVYASWRPRLDALMHHTQALMRYLNTGSPLVLLDQDTFEATKMNVEARLIDQLACTAAPPSSVHGGQQQQHHLPHRSVTASSSALAAASGLAAPGSTSLHGLSEADFVSVVDQPQQANGGGGGGVSSQPRYSVTSAVVGPRPVSTSPSSSGAASHEQLPPGSISLRTMNNPTSFANSSSAGAHEHHHSNFNNQNLDDVSSVGTVLNELDDPELEGDHHPILVYELVGNLPLESEGSAKYLEWMYSYAEVEQQRQKEAQQRKFSQHSHPRSRSVASNVSSLATPRGRHMPTEDTNPLIASGNASTSSNQNLNASTLRTAGRLASPVPHYVTAKELPTGSALSAEICYCAGLVFKEHPPQYRTCLERLQRVETQWQTASNARLISRLLSYVSMKLYHTHNSNTTNSNHNNNYPQNSSSSNYATTGVGGSTGSLPPHHGHPTILAVSSSNDVSFIASREDTTPST